MKKLLMICFTIGFIFILFGCENDDSKEKPVIVEFDYMDEMLPTNQAVRFEPDGYQDSLLWFWHGSPIFSPDGLGFY